MKRTAFLVVVASGSLFLVLANAQAAVISPQNPTGGSPTPSPQAATPARPTSSQAPAEDDATLRDRITELLKQGRSAEALPLLETLAATHPTDFKVQENLSSTIVTAARQLSDPKEQVQALLRARSILLRAQQLGDNSDNLKVLLEMLPANIHPGGLSSRPDVEAALQSAESAFAKGDYPTALAGYEKASLLDPANYSAALFAGDTCFRMDRTDEAGQWFAKAIAINPNEERAHRYWGDTLMKAGRFDEAEAKFIDAVVAEPYKQGSWVGLKRWAQATHSRIAQPEIEFTASEGTGPDGKPVIKADSQALGKHTAYQWRMSFTYAMIRSAWRTDKFKKTFPDETTYRHTLAEEVDALQTVAQHVETDSKDEEVRKALDPGLIALADLYDQGLLEPYVFLARADAGIAQDYPAYREAHADKIRIYLSSWVISARDGKK
jgi:tetratricopeptide (TPR) repeat protein